MEQPPDYEVADRSRYVIKLVKTIYGLKQSGRTWYVTLCHSLADLGFQKSEADRAVFYARVDAHIRILSIHVDNCTITGSSVKIQNEFKKRIGEKFKLTDLGPIDWLLGIEVKRNRETRTLSLSQHSYVETTLRRFHIANCKPASTPMDPNIQLSKAQSPTTTADIADMKNVPYREAIGSLMWAAVGTRPDIACVVGILSQFLDNPGRVHWEAVSVSFGIFRVRRLGNWFMGE